MDARAIFVPATLTMKLRMLGDTIRLRLSQTEVESMLARGRVEQTVRFGPEAVHHLRYVLVSAPDAERMHATFAEGVITVVVPAADVARWAGSEQVGMHVRQPTGDTRSLEILVEKDFRCLEPRGGHEDDDGFPNPKAAC